jgi:hypothetical protein
VGVGFSQLEFMPIAQTYIGMASGLSVPEVPSPKLTVPEVMDVNRTESGAAPEVGVAVRPTFIRIEPPELPDVEPLPLHAIAARVRGPTNP